MDGSEALEDEVVDEGERGDTEEHEDRDEVAEQHEDGDEVAELAAEIHDVGNVAEDGSGAGHP